MTDAGTPFEPRAAYPQLVALACEMRPDWDRTDLDDAMTGAHQAGWGWRDVYREVMRLAWTEGETPGTLRNSARRPGLAGPTGPDVNARGLEAVMAAFTETLARATGGQPVLSEDDDP